MKRRTGYLGTSAGAVTYAGHGLSPLQRMLAQQQAEARAHMLGGSIEVGGEPEPKAEPGE